MTLGRVGGQSEFDLETRLGNGMKMDETRNFRANSFRLPGRLTVNRQSLLSRYEQDPLSYEVASLLGRRMGETGLVSFNISLTMDAEVGTLLRLRSRPYSLFGNSMFKKKIGNPNIPKMAPVISVAGGELIARLDHKLYAGPFYLVQVEVVTPLVPKAKDAKWSIDIVDGGDLPVNTNDEKTVVFALVDRITFQIAAGQTPPMAQVSATLSFDPKAAMPKEALIIAPKRFNFTQNCLQAPGDSNELESCTLEPYLISGRAVAKLRFSGAGLVAPPNYMMIKIVTPDQNLQDSSWFIKLTDSMGVELGWGEDPVGVTVMQMLNSGVVYPAIPEIEGVMAFRFTTNKKVDPNGQILAGYPAGFVIKCNGDFLKKVSLKGKMTCINYPKERYFVITMERPLPPGNQAFAVTSTAPTEQPDPNMFFIIIRSPEGLVMDAAITIHGLEIQHGLQVGALPLFWSASEPMRAATIGLGFQLVDLLPEETEEFSPPIMQELVITMPQDFQQTVQKLSHIEVMHGSMPLPYAPGTWLVNNDPKQLRIFFDPLKTKILDIGRYKWTFPIFVPARLPAYNIFTMTICGPNTDNSTCNGPHDPRALVTFPWPGFNHGDVHPAAASYSMTGACIGLHATAYATTRTVALLAGIAAWRVLA